MIQHGLIKITDDLGDAKKCYLESIGKYGNCVIKKDHNYKTWLVEKCSSESAGGRDGAINEILQAVGSISRIKEEIRRKIRVIRKNNPPEEEKTKRQEVKPTVRKASSRDVLGFAPGNAPRIHSRVRPFCGTDDEIKKLRRGF
jgi:hypothetical protein